MRILFILSLLVFSSMAFAEETQVSMAEASGPSVERVWNFSANFEDSTISYPGKIKESGSGIGLSAGREFQISPQIVLTSRLGFRSLSTKERQIGNSTIQSRFQDFGFYQGIAYSYQAKNYRVLPFLELGYARGSYKDEERFSESFGAGTGTLKVDYARAQLALGLRVVTQSGLAPFIQYVDSRHYMANNADLEVTVEDQVFQENLPIGEDQREIKSRGVQVGIGYHF